MDKNLISNKYVRFGISCFNILYLIMIFALTGWTFLYELEFTSETGFYVFYIALSVIFLFLMVLTRNQIATRFVSLILLFPVFFLMLFSLDRPIIYGAPLAVGVIMFFVCRAGDTSKVILGSMYILMFVVGLAGYNILSSLFGGSAVETKLNYTVTDPDITSYYDMAKIDRLNMSSVSPDGKFRYYILDVKDNDRGKVIIVVEPNDRDIKYRFFNLIEAGYTTRIAKYQTRGVTPDIEWVINDEYSEGSDGSRYKLRYRFGEGTEWKTSTIRIPEKKNYLRFLNVN